MGFTGDDLQRRDDLRVQVVERLIVLGAHVEQRNAAGIVQSSCCGDEV
jgi:hypothetical protein